MVKGKFVDVRPVKTMEKLFGDGLKMVSLIFAEVVDLHGMLIGGMT